MNRRIRYDAIPTGNPFANAVMVIVGALAVGAAIVLGFVAFLVLACVILVLAGIIGLRLWWYRRKLQKGFRADDLDSTGEFRSRNETRVIEGEYHTVSTDKDREPHDPTFRE